MQSCDLAKQEIVNYATDLFLTKGFKSVTMDDLASEMGMSKKTIYTFFKTKNELVKASTEFVFYSISAGIDKIKEEDLNPIKELFTINNFVFKHLKNESSSPEYQLLKYYPKIHFSLNKRKFGVVHKCIVEGLERGKQLGMFRKEIDPEIISRFYFFSIAQIRDKELFPEEYFKAYEIIKSYLDYHIRGIATPKGIEFLEQTIYKVTLNNQL